jgi:hypothetical protein
MTQMTNQKFSNSQSPNTRNTLGIVPEVYEKLLERIESNSKTCDSDNTRRKYHRIRYHSPFLNISLNSRQMSRTNICVATRNISRSGVSVLHSNFVHTGTSATVTLERLDSTTVSVRGTVVRCQHISGIVHEVGIQFDVPIHPQEFIRFLPLDAFRSVTTVDPEELRGNVDIITSQPDQFSKFEDELMETHIHLQCYGSVEEFLLTDPTNDRVVIAVHDRPVIDGPKAAHQLRTGEYLGPLILSGNVDSKQDTGAFQLSTADTFLALPVNQNDLYTALAEFLLFDWKTETLEKIRSYKDPEAIKIIHDEFAKISVRLDQLLRTKNLEGMLNQCMILESIAPLVGARALTDLSQQLVQALQMSADFEQIEDQINETRLLISNMRNAA